MSANFKVSLPSTSSLYFQLVQIGNLHCQRNKSMVIVTQLEACCNKTAFVRIFINCKLLIQTLETETENLIEKEYYHTTSISTVKGWVFVPCIVYTKTTNRIVTQTLCETTARERLTAACTCRVAKHRYMCTQNNREKLILLLILIKSEEFLIR